MTGAVDWSTIGSIAQTAVVVVGAGGVLVKVSRWKEGVDKHLTEQDKGMERLGERLGLIESELRPNGGSSHHDVLRREIREAVEEAARGRRRRWW